MLTLMLCWRVRFTFTSLLQKSAGHLFKKAGILCSWRISCLRSEKVRCIFSFIMASSLFFFLTWSERNVIKQCRYSFIITFFFKKRNSPKVHNIIEKQLKGETLLDSTNIEKICIFTECIKSRKIVQSLQKTAQVSSTKNSLATSVELDKNYNEKT